MFGGRTRAVVGRGAGGFARRAGVTSLDFERREVPALEVKGVGGDSCREGEEGREVAEIKEKQESMARGGRADRKQWML